MITKDKSVFDAKVAEVCKFSESNNFICLDIADFEGFSKDATEEVLIELESMVGVDDLLCQMTNVLDSIQSVCWCDIIMHIETYSMIMSDFAKVDEAMKKSALKYRIFKRAISYDEGLEDGHHKLTLFLYKKEN